MKDNIKDKNIYIETYKDNKHWIKWSLIGIAILLFVIGIFMFIYNIIKGIFYDTPKYVITLNSKSKKTVKNNKKSEYLESKERLKKAKNEVEVNNVV